MDLKIRTINGEESYLKPEWVNDLRSKIRGPLIDRSHTLYDQTRSVWNGMIDRKPTLIAKCMGVSDVINAVNFARKYNLLVAVRGGGHSVAGFSVCDDGLVIDLSEMNAIRVDPQARTVRAEPGATLGMLDRETQAFGLVVPSGIVTSTGISGLTLGGGAGWLSRAWGLTCDNLLSADVVNADGCFLHASEHENEDLFWALRGGGGNFGIVTSFEYRCYPFGPMALAGVVFHPIEKARELLSFYKEYTSSVSEKVTTLALIRQAPDSPIIPAEYRGKMVCGIVACYAGRPEEGMEAIKPIKEWHRPFADVLITKPFLVHQSMFDAGQIPGNYYYWKSHYFNELTDETLDAIIKQGSMMVSPLSVLTVLHLGGAVARIGEEDTAYPNRTASYLLNLNGGWSDRSAHETNIAWVRNSWDALLPFATGSRYINFDAEDQPLPIYGMEKLERLQRIKSIYDPRNLFRLNHNIKPSVVERKPSEEMDRSVKICFEEQSEMGV